MKLNFSDLYLKIFYSKNRGDIQFTWATVRAEFEKHRHVKDLRLAKLLIDDGERRLFLHMHPKPKKFIFSPGGLMFEREHIYSDCHLDLWHPLEKAQYPYYFERREQLKKEYIKNWEKNYGNSGGQDHSH